MSRRDLEDAYLTNALIDAHADDPEFGIRSLADEVAGAGLVAGERRIWRLCSEQERSSTTVRTRDKIPQHECQLKSQQPQGKPARRAMVSVQASSTHHTPVPS